jgi:CRP/FNR family cyclic AMP-dependent transcriptional regulator
MTNPIFDGFPLFADLDPEQKELISTIFNPRIETADTTLFKQGEPADKLYLIVDGEVVIRYKPEDGPAIIIARLRSGSAVGWSAALGNPVYTSSAICSTSCSMLFVQGQDLRQLCYQHPGVGGLVLDRLAEVVAERLHTSHQHVLTLLEKGLGKHS